MARRHKQYDDDDGRTIVDMSDLSHPPMIGFGRLIRQKPAQFRQPEGKKDDRPWEDQGFTREERKIYALAAMRAALLIGLVFVVALVLIIALLLLAWS